MGLGQEVCLGPESSPGQESNQNTQIFFSFLARKVVHAGKWPKLGKWAGSASWPRLGTLGLESSPGQESSCSIVLPTCVMAWQSAPH